MSFYKQVSIHLGGPAWVFEEVAGCFSAATVFLEDLGELATVVLRALGSGCCEEEALGVPD